MKKFAFREAFPEMLAERYQHCFCTQIVESRSSDKDIHKTSRALPVPHPDKIEEFCQIL